MTTQALDIYPVKLSRVSYVVSNLKKFAIFPYPQVFNVHELWYMLVFHLYLYENTFVNALISEDMAKKIASRLIDHWHQLPVQMKWATDRVQLKEMQIDWKQGHAPFVAKDAEVYAEFITERIKKNQDKRAIISLISDEVKDIAT